MNYSNKYVEQTPEGKILLPNVKKIFIPDEGMELADGDLGGADAQVYGRDSDCKALNDFFANPKGKLYAWVGSQHLQREITAESPEYKDYKASHHGFWYGVGDKKMALTLGCSLSKAQKLMEFYHHIYPERNRWHERLKREILTRGYIQNKFGRRFYFLDKNNPNLMNEVTSMIPQSTVGEVVNRSWIKIVRTLPEAEVLLQVHDSLVIQYPYGCAEAYREKIKKYMGSIPIPYDPVLYIPADIKVSRVSYGDTEKLK